MVKKSKKIIRAGKISFVILLFIFLAFLIISMITKFQVMFWWIASLSAFGVIFLLIITFLILKAVNSTGDWINTPI